MDFEDSSFGFRIDITEINFCDEANYVVEFFH
jgi:hypothetical protein